MRICIKKTEEQLCDPKSDTKNVIYDRGLVRWCARRSAKESWVCVKLKLTDGKWDCLPEKGRILGVTFQASQRLERDKEGHEAHVEGLLWSVGPRQGPFCKRQTHKVCRWGMKGAGLLKVELWLLMRCYLGKEGQRRGLINFLEHLWLWRKIVYQGYWKADGGKKRTAERLRSETLKFLQKITILTMSFQRAEIQRHKERMDRAMEATGKENRWVTQFVPPGRCVTDLNTKAKWLKCDMLTKFKPAYMTSCLTWNNNWNLEAGKAKLNKSI